jgi:hypothetical protein
MAQIREMAVTLNETIARPPSCEREPHRQMVTQWALARQDWRGPNAAWGLSTNNGDNTEDPR